MSDKPYVNKEGANIRVRTDKGEKEHIDIYDRDPRELIFRFNNILI